MTFNVHQGFNNEGVLDPDLFVHVLHEADADIVALQESDTVRFTSGNLDIVHYLATRLGYHAYHGPATREQSFGIALLSRFPILEASYVPLTSGSDNRFVVKARLQVGPHEATVLAVHMALPEADRSRQVQEILAVAAGGGRFTLLAGDFNSCPRGRCATYEGRNDTVYEQITARYQDAWVGTPRFVCDRDGCREAPPLDDIDHPDGYTWEAWAPVERIDYIFVSEDIRVRQVERVTREAALRASDHLPVVATVSFAD